MTQVGYTYWHVHLDTSIWTCSVGHMNRTAQVAAKVVAARVAADLSEVALAEATNIPRSTLKRRLDGASPFTVEELDSIATVLGVPFASLLEDNAA